MRNIRPQTMLRSLSNRIANGPQMPMAGFRTTATQHGPSDENLAHLAKRIPKGTWDTHMHVADPDRFPLAADPKYTPHTHTIEETRNGVLGKLGISNMVIVQPSIYGEKNDCLLDGLKQLGTNSGRGIVQFDPDTISEQQLREWHDLGVRGVRVNFKSVEKEPSEDEEPTDKDTTQGKSLTALLEKYAAAIRPLKTWMIEIYIGMDQMNNLLPAVRELKDTKFCIDHFGHPSTKSVALAHSADELSGFRALANLVDNDNVWIKLSGAYRIDSKPDHPLVKSIALYLLKTRPDRCVFATDWPHTRYEDIDVTPYLEELFNWCEEADVPLEQICVQNAKQLFDA